MLFVHTEHLGILGEKGLQHNRDACDRNLFTLDSLFKVFPKKGNPPPYTYLFASRLSTRKPRTARDEESARS